MFQNCDLLAEMSQKYDLLTHSVGKTYTDTPTEGPPDLRA